jgi:hypothetical protein
MAGLLSQNTKHIHSGVPAASSTSRTRRPAAGGRPSGTGANRPAGQGAAAARCGRASGPRLAGHPAFPASRGGAGPVFARQAQLSGIHTGGSAYRAFDSGA